MIEAYKIAIRVSLIDSVSKGLALMSSKFATAEHAANGLNKQLKEIGKMSLIGGGLVAIGAGGLHMLEEPLKKAQEYSRYIANMRQMGLGDDQIKEADKFVKSTDVINTSMMDRMRIFTEAQGAFRESGKTSLEALDAAKKMMPILATYEVASSTLSGNKHAAAEGAMRNLNKTVELMGGLGNPERAKAIVDGVFKTVQSSGKMVDEKQLKQFFAYGSSATNQQNLRGVFGGLEPIIGELGGSTVGTGLRTGYNRVNGMTALLPKVTASEMQRLGMADSTGRKQTLDLATLQATNAVDYAKKMMELYSSHGIKSQVDMERENSILYGTNGAKVYNKIMSQMPVLQESMAAYDRSGSASDVVNDPANKSLMAQQKLAKKWEDFQLTVGQDGGLLDIATIALSGLAIAVSSVTDFAKEHPTLTKFAALTLASVSALAVLGGGLILFAAAIKSAQLVGEVFGWGGKKEPFVGPAEKKMRTKAWEMAKKSGGWVKDKVSSGASKAWEMAKRNPKMVKGAFKGAAALGGAFGLVDTYRSDKNAGAKNQTAGQKVASYAQGAMSGAAIGMMFGPIGAIVGAALGLVYTAVVRNWDKCMAFTSKAWTKITAFAKSGIGNISKTILNWSPLGLFYKAFAAVMNWFGVKLPADFTGFGAMILEGLWNGLKSKAAAVVGWMSGLASKVSSAFTSKSEIFSPSRLFMRHGSHIVDGLVLGLNNNAHKAHAAIRGLNPADPYRNTSRLNTVNSGHGGRTTQVSTTVHLDGKAVAHVVSKHQARELNRPMAGGTRFDAQRAVPHVAMGY